MKINELSPAPGSRSKKKRLGKGPGSGHGKTGGRGHKGQKSRSGGKIRPGFEGGQMPLHRRLPKKGFKNIFKKPVSVVNLKDLNRFSPGSNIEITDLISSGLAKKRGGRIKLLAKGKIDFPINIKVHQVSEAARRAVEQAGGKVSLV